jgi:hypothetical protein
MSLLVLVEAPVFMPASEAFKPRERGLEVKRALAPEVLDALLKGRDFICGPQQSWF